MLLFCRNCSKELVVTPDKTCASCGAKPVKATAFCRYCANATCAEDLVCPTCGAAIKPIPSRVRVLNKETKRLVKLGEITNKVIIVTLIATYVWFALPSKVVEPIKNTVSDMVMQSTGYTALPINSISSFPAVIQPFEDLWMAHNIEEVLTPEGVAINTTQQLTIYAIYKNTALEDVTANCTYQSSNEMTATVNASGFVKAVGSGYADIMVSYTVVPGTANFTGASAGKVPVTFSVNVSVTVY